MPTAAPRPISTSPRVSRRTLAAGAAWAVPAAAVVAAAPAYAASDCATNTKLTITAVCRTGQNVKVTYNLTESCPGGISLGNVDIKLTRPNNATETKTDTTPSQATVSGSATGLEAIGVGFSSNFVPKTETTKVTVTQHYTNNGAKTVSDEWTATATGIPTCPA